MLGFDKESRKETLEKINNIIDKIPDMEHYRNHLSNEFNYICDVFDRLSAPDPKTGKPPVITEVHKAEFEKLYKYIVKDLRFLSEYSKNLDYYESDIDELRERLYTDSLFIKGYNVNNKSTISKINSDEEIELSIFDSVSQMAEIENENIKDTTKTNPFNAMGNLRGQHDDMRYMNKIMLNQISENYKDFIDKMEQDDLLEEEGKIHIDEKLRANINQIKSILTDIDEYSKIDSTAADVNPGDKKAEKLHDKEVRLYDSILTNLIELNKDLQDQGIDRDIKDNNYNDIFRIAANCIGYFEGQRDGNLVPDDENAIVINAKGVNIEVRNNEIAESEGLIHLDKNVPLFPHDPSYNDIKQGQLGDCYLLASLSSIAMNNADKIKECMVDNKDGTVTVRFWQKNLNDNGEDSYTPLYVTVDKVVPELGSAQDCLWVQIIERAYAASGLSTKTDHTFESDTYNQAVPDKEELDRMYKTYSKLPVHERPSHLECPWLIDESGNLHKYKPQYLNIDGGKPGTFIEHFLGKGYHQNTIRTHDYIFDDIEPMRTFDHVLIEACKNNIPCLFKDEVEMEHFRTMLVNNIDPLKYYDLMYRLVSGTRDNIPRHPNGNIDISDDNALAAYMVTNDIYDYMDYVREEIKNNSRKPHKMDDILPKIGGRWKDKNDKLYKYRQEVNQRGIKDTLYTNALFTISNGIDSLNNYIKPHQEQYDGEYNQRELDFYDKIKDALLDKKPVTLSTKTSPNNTGDREALNGMNYQHAYTITGVVTKNINGKDLKFFTVRNPHAEKGRNYGVDSNGKTIAYASKSTKNGEGIIEITDVFKECVHVSINESVKPERVMPSGIKNPVTRTDVSKYMRCLEPLVNQFNTKSWLGKDSRQYKEVQIYLKSLTKELPNALGKDMSQLGDMFEGTVKAVDAYLKHCTEVKIDNSVRNKRMEAAHAIKELANAARANIKDPNQHAKKQAAASITEILLALNNKNPSNEKKEQLVEDLMKSKEFTKSYGSGNYLQTNKINAMEPKKMFKAFVEYSKKINNIGVEAPAKVNAQPKLAQTQPQAENVNKGMGLMQ